MGTELNDALKIRDENQRKWGDYFERGGAFTPEIQREMKADNKHLEEVCRETTKECLKKRNNDG